MKRLIFIVVAFMLIAVLVVIGRALSLSAEDSAQVPQVGKPAPDFRLTNLTGQSFSLSDLRGKLIFINFWASWCLPCRLEMPFIQQLFEDKKWSDKGLVILAVNIGESSSVAREFMEKNALSFMVLLDTEQKVAMGYNIRSIPTTYLVDKNGIIRGVQFGAFTSKVDIETWLGKIVPEVNPE